MFYLVCVVFPLKIKHAISFKPITYSSSLNNMCIDYLLLLSHSQAFEGKRMIE